ncbi:response regulator [Nostoc sp. FACHB-110]|uniref:response regulator n=1 Tax=Nostoc sp. FACHB-110 TaxID=2692834 RepID=UPI0016871822|nr:response regulator [Nostoc sp. FACHB-110]MBD2437723.1 response regulator [Nostoc sp. FACHB-110]
MNIIEEVNITTKTILLIDNEVRVREVVELCLQDLAGWDVIIADSPLIGLQLSAINSPDAIVMDSSGHNIINFQLINQIRSNPKTQATPIIFFSAEAKWLDSHILEKYQIVGVILKPFDPISLPTQIAKVLGWNLPSISD